MSAHRGVTCPHFEFALVARAEMRARYKNLVNSGVVAYTFLPDDGMETLTPEEEYLNGLYAIAQEDEERPILLESQVGEYRATFTKRVA